MNMTRRTFLGTAVSGAAVASTLAAGVLTPRSVGAALPPETFFAKSPAEAIKAVLGTYQSRTDPAVELGITDTVEMADMVPVSVETTLDNVESITIVADMNPNPIIANFKLDPRLQPYVATRVRLGGSGDVQALVKAGGTIYHATKYVQVAISGCGDPEAGPHDIVMSDRILLRTTKSHGGLIVRVLMHHPMTPPRKDPSTGLPVSGRFIQEVTAKLNGETVLSGDWSAGVSADPYLSFKIRQATQGDIIRITWTDNTGHSASSEVKVG
ncbi:MAG: thiosulfate oxidation carrier complex protein SoxZ [Chromatiaceae bacterium]